MGKEVYFEDFNIELNRKLSKEVRLVLTYLYQNYNRDVIEGRTGFGHIYSHIGIAEVFYRISPKKNFRTELQHMYTEQNTKSWAVLLAEYTVAPHWFVAAFDQWNYGNDDSNERFHYITGQFGYTRGSNRVVVGTDVNARVSCAWAVSAGMCPPPMVLPYLLPVASDA